MTPAQVRLLALLCGVELLTVLGVGSYAALLPLLRDEWGLSNTAAGWIDGAFQAGYLAAVPFLVSLTDRLDAKRIVAVSAVVGGAGTIGFGLFAHDLWSACLFRALGGIGLAGTFMPALRILADRFGAKAQSRAVAVYTAFYSAGSSLSVLLAGSVAQLAGWPMAFLAAGLGSVIAAALVVAFVPGTPGPRGHAARRTLDWRPSFANREALQYSLGYMAHMWELFGFRAWLVAFLTYCAARSGGGLSSASVTLVASAILLLSLPASILGNELALRHGRRRFITGCIMASVVLGLLTGLAAQAALPIAILAAAFYVTAISADSSALTAGAVGASAADHRGATMALHTVLGFIAATMGPLAFGAALDLAGPQSAFGWFAAFAVLAAGGACGPFLLRFRRRA